jgi:anthranilate phosphoribosyltransferase
VLFRSELLRDGVCTLLFDAETPNAQASGGPADAIDARATADWIRQAMAGTVAVPHPILNQVACSLYACGYAESLNQAKAIVAIESGNLAAA